MKFLTVSFLAASLAVSAFAADITGKWTAELAGRDGQKREMKMDFKQEGEKLTGTVSGNQGDIQITDGKVMGDDVSFTVVRNFNGNEFKSQYTGKVSGKTLKLNTKMRDREIEINAKKAE